MKDQRKSALLICLVIVLVCAEQAVSQTEQIRLKLADGSYMTVDDAWDSPQGVWYRRGGLRHLLAKEKVKMIERGTPAPAVPASSPTPSSNDDDHFEVPEMVAKTPTTSNGVYDQPAWIYLK